MSFIKGKSRVKVPQKRKRSEIAPLRKRSRLLRSQTINLSRKVILGELFIRFVSVPFVYVGARYSIYFYNRSPSPRANARAKRRERSPPPRPLRIHIGRLTRNVTKDHIMEIFSTYGIIRSVEMPPDRLHPQLSKGFAYVEFNSPDEAENAMKHMDGGTGTI